MDKHYNYACMGVSETALNVLHDRNSSNSRSLWSFVSNSDILKNHFFQSKQYVYIYFTKSYNFKNFRKEVPNVVLSNEPLET